MRYWKILIQATDTEAWLKLSDEGTPLGYRTLDNKAINPTKIGDYTTIDDDPEPPGWAADAEPIEKSWQGAE